MAAHGVRDGRQWGHAPANHEIRAGHQWGQGCPLMGSGAPSDGVMVGHQWGHGWPTMTLNRAILPTSEPGTASFVLKLWKFDPARADGDSCSPLSPDHRPITLKPCPPPRIPRRTPRAERGTSRQTAWLSVSQERQWTVAVELPSAVFAPLRLSPRNASPAESVA